MMRWEAAGSRGSHNGASMMCWEAASTNDSQNGASMMYTMQLALVAVMIVYLSCAGKQLVIVTIIIMVYLRCAGRQLALVAVKMAHL